jgi:hypothetical protein
MQEAQCMSSTFILKIGRSTKTAETLPASEGFDRAFYLRAVSTWMGIDGGLFLALNNSSLYAAVSTTRAPKEKRLKVDLALLHERFENRDRSAVLCTAPETQQADAMTK